MINANIYDLANKPTTQLNDPLESMGKVMTLKDLALKSRKAQREDTESELVKQAIANNMGEDGGLNRQGYLSDLTRINPEKALEMQMAYGKVDNQEAEAQKNKIESLSKTMEMVSPIYESLGALKTPQERAMAWPSAHQKFKELGLPVEKIPGVDQYSDAYLQDALGQIKNTKSYLEKEKIRADIKAKQDGTDDPYRFLRLEKMRGEIEQERFKKTPEGRLKSLGAEETKRLDNAKLALNAIQGMTDALATGDSTFSLIGDNNFTQQSALFEEAVGRMQSGGAIGIQEADRFKSLRPKAQDPRKIQIKKLNDLAKEMTSRISSLGFKPSEVGVNDFRNTYEEKNKKPVYSQDVQDYAKKHGMSAASAQAIKDSRVGQ